jgi:5-methyltetrahydrofolate--homocysteine methyltransferase
MRAASLSESNGVDWRCAWEIVEAWNLKEDMEQHLGAIAASFLAFKYFEAEAAIKRALEAGVPKDEITKALMTLFLEALDRYDVGRYSIAHLTAAATIFETGFELTRVGVPPKGKVVIGTLGSSHYLGKDIIRLLLMADGFEVVDLGEIVFPDKVVEAVEREKPDIVALASMIIACLPLQQMTIGALQATGLKDKLKVLIGGAVTSERWAQTIGADGWAPDAPQAVEEANRLLRQLKEGA